MSTKSLALICVSLCFTACGAQIDEDELSRSSRAQREQAVDASHCSATGYKFQLMHQNISETYEYTFVGCAMKSRIRPPNWQ